MNHEGSAEYSQKSNIEPLKHGKKKRWDRCICYQIDYFEGDGSQKWVS
jgi:hypothetical protein